MELFLPETKTMPLPIISAEELPLLSITKRMFSDVSLKKTKVLCAQHIVGTTRALFQVLFSLGLLSRNLSVIGKCYSSNPAIVELLQREGVKVDPSSLEFNPLVSFDQQYKENLNRFLNEHLADTTHFDHVVIIDDGGELLAALHKLDLPKHHILGIEQTSAGYHRLKKMDLEIPVINVARSHAKLKYETPFIIDQVIDIAFKKIEQLSLTPQTILIMGNGVIGQGLQARLCNDYQVTMYDAVRALSDIDQEQLKKILPTIDLIFGCTGQTSIPHHLHPFLKKDAILVSASSSDREFDSVSFRQSLTAPCTPHQDITSHNVHLLNCGFPVNFDSNFFGIDIPNFQLTRALLLAGVLQALTTRPAPGLHELDPLVQNKIIHTYCDLYGIEVKSLHNKGQDNI